MPSHSPIYDALAAVAPSKAIPHAWIIWDPPHTPLSTLPSVSAAIVTYLAVVFGGRRLMKGRQPFGESLQIPFLIHNLALTIGSGLLLAVMLEEIIPILSRGGLFYGICHEAAWTSRLETFYIINYWFKFWELLDTVFLVLKKKPLQFLHVYHHAATALLCFSQLHGKTSVSWVVITLNLTVHVLMYFYYALSSLKIRVPWKQAVTVCQITQFFIDLGVVYFASYVHWARKWKLPFVGDYTTCAGKEYAAIAGMACLTSYLFLFLSFYAKTYNKKPSSKSGRKSGGQKQVQANGNGHSNGHSVARKSN